MAGNSFGEIFSIMTFGESHGKAIGVVIDGVKPNVKLSIDDLQKELNRRKPGQSKISTSRNEEDKIEILSGIFNGKTTGTPICMIIWNKDQDSKIYEKYKDVFRPGHAGYTYLKKYGIYDYRGGGRASGRETASRVAAGAIAKQILKSFNIDIIGYTKQIGSLKVKKFESEEIEKNPLRCPDKAVAKKMERLITKIKKNGDSIGGVVELVIKNCPVGLGEPVFDKLNAELGKALLSIGGVKGFEIGVGFKVANLLGSQMNDEFYYDSIEKRIRTKTNRQGGILGGISNGEDIICRIAIKPPSSILKSQKTIDYKHREVDISIEGRHDPCLCPRIVPVAEAMAAIVLLDFIMKQEFLLKRKNIKELRKRIDLIDKNILFLLAFRNETSKAIGEIKNKKGMHITDKKRESEVMESRIDLGKKLNLNNKFIESLFSLIIKESKLQQNDKK